MRIVVCIIKQEASLFEKRKTLEIENFFEINLEYLSWEIQVGIEISLRNVKNYDIFLGQMVIKRLQQHFVKITKLEYVFLSS